MSQEERICGGGSAAQPEDTESTIDQMGREYAQQGGKGFRLESERGQNQPETEKAHPENKKAQKNLLQRYPMRHIILATALILLCAFYILREVRPVADFATTYIAHPWQRFFGMIFDIFPFSVAECLVVFAAAGILAYLTITLVNILRKTEKLQRAYGALIALVAGAMTIFALICWLWSISYYSYTFEELSGIEAEEVSVEELKEVTVFFAEVANRASEAVSRDENGVHDCDKKTILSESPALYACLPEQFAFLEGSELHPKPLAFSYLMSHTCFTGVFFPLTGEANVNIHAPDNGTPSTVAHELAHQRGVTREQDANFTAVLVCMESGDVDFTYSGAILALNHLANSLRQVSYEDWEEVYSCLGENVRKDLAANCEYWTQFQTPAADLTEAVYEEFLYSQGQELGMRSYGACVDLLVSYYVDVAQQDIR